MRNATEARPPTPSTAVPNGGAPVHTGSRPSGIPGVERLVDQPQV